MVDSRPVSEQKDTLRKVVRLTRDALSYELILEWSTQTIDRLMRLPKFAAAKTVFTYVSVKSEIRTRDLIEQLWERDIQVLVPIMLGDELGMCQIHDWNEIRVDSYGRCTPISDAKLFTGEPDVNLVPGLAFTESGDRLGSGYGHYDRFVAKFPGTTHIGLSYELQLKESLPVESHDQTLNYIATQQRVIACPRPPNPIN